jgi:hypothetical protein
MHEATRSAAGRSPLLKPFLVMRESREFDLDPFGAEPVGEVRAGRRTEADPETAVWLKLLESYPRT